MTDGWRNQIALFPEDRLPLTLMRPSAKVPDMFQYRKIFKRTSTGATQVWWCERQGSAWRTVSGQKDGAKVESGWTVAKPKNIGRKNEVNSEDQAELEINAAYTKKLAQGGYHDTEDGIDEAKFFKPMLAKSVDDEKFDFPVYTQPKLDGVRCIAMASGLWTRQGKPILSCPHIEGALRPFFLLHPTAILDGELYADKLADDFNKVISLVRKQSPNSQELDECADTIEYHVYDYPTANGGWRDRMIDLDGLAATGQLEHPVVVVPTDYVRTQAELDELNCAYLAAGYEGQMVRIPNGGYENKRSKNLLKRKEFQDREFRIVRINEGIGNRTGMAGNIQYELGDGRMFASGIKGSHDYSRQLLKDADKYVGGTGTVRFFALTPDGVPRFPVTVAVYEGERDS